MVFLQTSLVKVAVVVAVVWGLLLMVVVAATRTAVAVGVAAAALVLVVSVVSAVVAVVAVVAVLTQGRATVERVLRNADVLRMVLLRQVLLFPQPVGIATRRGTPDLLLQVQALDLSLELAQCSNYKMMVCLWMILMAVHTGLKSACMCSNNTPIRILFADK
jgi:hypothetical protein